MYPRGIWFADAMLSFSSVTLFLFSFVFVYMLSLKPRPFVQKFFVLRYACVPTATRVLPFFSFRGDVAFSEYFRTITVFSLYEEYAARFPLPDASFYLEATGWVFDLNSFKNSMVITYSRVWIRRVRLRNVLGLSDCFTPGKCPPVSFYYIIISCHTHTKKHRVNLRFHLNPTIPHW